MDKYGSFRPPAVPLDQISVPTALFYGTLDKLADVADNLWLTKQISPDYLAWSKAYELDHLSFSLAKDMTWFKQDVMSLVNKHSTNVFADPALIATN